MCALDRHARTLCRVAFDGFLVVDDARRYVRVNEAAAELLGVKLNEAIGLSLEQFTPPDRLPLVAQLWAKLERSGELEGRGPLLRADGSQHFVRWRAVWGFSPGLHLFVLRALGPPGPIDGHPLPRLTPRELEVLQLAAEGHSTRVIADLLVVSAGTAKTHLEHVYAKLDARDRVSAVAIAMRLGIIS